MSATPVVELVLVNKKEYEVMKKEYTDLRQVLATAIQPAVGILGGDLIEARGEIGKLRLKVAELEAKVKRMAEINFDDASIAAARDLTAEVLPSAQVGDQTVIAIEHWFKIRDVLTEALDALVKARAELADSIERRQDLLIAAENWERKYDQLRAERDEAQAEARRLRETLDDCGKLAARALAETNGSRELVAICDLADSAVGIISPEAKFRAVVRTEDSAGTEKKDAR